MNYKKTIDGMIQKEWFDYGLIEGEYEYSGMEANPYSDSRRRWRVAESYILEEGRIRVEKADEVRGYDPMTDPEVLTSFLRLGRIERTQSPSARQHALKWVEKYGLLEHGETDLPYANDGEFDVRPKVQQRSADASELVMEAMEARHAASLYEDLRNGKFERLVEQGKRFKKAKEERQLTKVEAFLEKSWAGHQGESYERISRTFLPWLTASFLKGLLAGKLSDVRIAVSSGCLLPETANPFSDFLRPPSGIAYQWWDLKSAIYLQLALVMGGGEPMKWCENPNCRTPFPAKRKDNRFCKPGCRSSARN